MANAATPNYIAPIHHQTFKLSDEPPLEPIERLQAALDHEKERLVWRQIGESFCVSNDLEDRPASRFYTATNIRYMA